MINPHQFVSLILEPALKATGLYSTDAMYLMTCTALVESKLTHLRQLPDGIGAGLYCITPQAYKEVIEFLRCNHNLRNLILIYLERTKFPDKPGSLVADISLGVLVARVKYFMCHRAIPSYRDPFAQADYYTTYYSNDVNTDKTQEFIRNARDIEGWINHEDIKEDGSIS